MMVGRYLMSLNRSRLTDSPSTLDRTFSRCLIRPGSSVWSAAAAGQGAHTALLEAGTPAARCAAGRGRRVVGICADKYFVLTPRRGADVARPHRRRQYAWPWSRFA